MQSISAIRTYVKQQVAEALHEADVERIAYENGVQAAVLSQVLGLLAQSATIFNLIYTNNGTARVNLDDLCSQQHELIRSTLEKLEENPMVSHLMSHVKQHRDETMPRIEPGEPYVEFEIEDDDLSGFLGEDD